MFDLHGNLLEMSLKFHLSRPLAALIVMIALMAVPSVAQAHAGHAHGAPSSVGAPPDLQSGADLQSPPAQAAAELPAEIDAQPSDEPRNCADTCCSDAPCGGCVAFSLVQAPSIRAPLPAGVGDWRDPALMQGLIPEGLRKPPRSFL
jgi:hypothetical protein